MKIFISLLLIALIFISCDRNNDEDEFYTINAVVVDWDTKSPIAGAKVYVHSSTNYFILIDSLITDANGRGNFRYRRTDPEIRTTAFKSGYEHPVSLNGYIPIAYPRDNRTDSFFLARPSFLHTTLRRTGTFPVTDSIKVNISGYRAAIAQRSGYTYFSTFFHGITRLANNPMDTSLTIPFVYFNPPFQKAYINWHIIRNGAIISSYADSTDLNQFGTKNYLLNY